MEDTIPRQPNIDRVPDAMVPAYVPCVKEKDGIKINIMARFINALHATEQENVASAMGKAIVTNRRVIAWSLTPRRKIGEHI